jgi:hypothetical protein
MCVTTLLLTATSGPTLRAVGIHAKYARFIDVFATIALVRATAGRTDIFVESLFSRPTKTS